ncbi:hypothetical protein SAMN05428975_5130 [Mucilaginibacter sp. OK268]|uniref:hypothetical protein n=1 Tax=Mucilaginibacter sp. OK268 TaxID=1881048 RepID=UPI00088D8F58|nr:hypothetical protein [Mucilaginibacter sp. OK268]SDP99717.1 hypothetical protein SAMN05428975_5130 [Mucilaginibacter sp. OK268]
MNNEINHIDDLFDDSISKSLRKLGFIFPRTCADFNKIEENIKVNKLSMPMNLRDPSVFLGKKVFQNHSAITLSLSDYTMKLAQAAREGNDISEEVKDKMEKDKLAAKNKNKAT